MNGLISREETSEQDQRNSMVDGGTVCQLGTNRLVMSWRGKNREAKKSSGGPARMTTLSRKKRTIVGKLGWGLKIKKTRETAGDTPIPIARVTKKIHPDLGKG